MISLDDSSQKIFDERHGITQIKVVPYTIYSISLYRYCSTYHFPNTL